MNRILVVEDDDSLREEMAMWLEFEGYHPFTAATGREAIEEIDSNSFDVVVSDIMMPDLDGFELLAELRKRADTQLLPVIFVTARSERRDVRLGMQLGADDYITKPFTRAELLEAVETRLTRRTAHAQQMTDSVAALQRVLHYTLPHELRTPLAGILGFADLMLLDAETLNPSEIAEMAHIIHQSGQRLQRLIENYLLYAQIELMREDLEKLRTLRSARFGGASDIVRQIAIDLAAEYERSADLQLFLDECDPMLSLSAVDWEKIVEEVVDNAFKFSKRGAPVLIGAGMDEEGYLLSVQDHGRGMTPEQVKLIGACVQFDRKIFEQQGLGLGMTIARSLTELYAGSFHIQSEQNSGTRIFVRLPLPKSAENTTAS